MATLTVELEDMQQTYFRKNTSVWDLLAVFGGFAVSFFLVSQMCYGFIGMNNSQRLSYQYMSSQYQVREGQLDNRFLAEVRKRLADEKEKQESIVPPPKKEETQQEEDPSEDLAPKDVSAEAPKEASARSENTIENVEREIKEQNLDSIVDEIMTRQKFNFKFDSMSKRFFSCFDKEGDEKLKEIRGLADIKFQNELDISRILRKIRNFESMAHFMLSDRQKYLLRFHSR